MTGKIQVVVGGQFGSEGKGHACAELAKREGPMLAVRTGGPNAGHTVRDSTGREYKLRQVPVAAVVNSQAVSAIAAGSLVQVDLTEQECKEVGLRFLCVDLSATILEPAHIAIEQGDPTLAWGSTQKGIGAARADRIHRTARTVAQEWGTWSASSPLEPMSVSTLARSYLVDGYTVQIEAAQGYGLGLHTQYYPKTTSANCRAIDALADVGLSTWQFPNAELEIWVVIRPNPIRVAGDSGPLADETTWKALGLPEERTTVTNKIRRVGGWDADLVAAAVRENGTTNVKLWLNMADHRFPWLAGRTSLEGLNEQALRLLYSWLAAIERHTGASVRALGTGPDTAIFLED